MNNPEVKENVDLIHKNIKGEIPLLTLKTIIYILKM